MPKYEHVAIFKQGDGFWLILDFMTLGNIDARVVSDDLVKRLCKYNRYVEVNKPATKPWRTGVIVSVSCVSLTKLYLGIKETAVLTSDDLYSYLSGEKIGLVKKLLSPFRWLWFYCKSLAGAL